MLIVHLTYFNRESFTRHSQIKYTVNLANAKSRFRLIRLGASSLAAGLGTRQTKQLLAKSVFSFKSW